MPDSSQYHSTHLASQWQCLFNVLGAPPFSTVRSTPGAVLFPQYAVRSTQFFRGGVAPAPPFFTVRSTPLAVLFPQYAVHSTLFFRGGFAPAPPFSTVRSTPVAVLFPQYAVPIFPPDPRSTQYAVPSLTHPKRSSWKSHSTRSTHPNALPENLTVLAVPTLTLFPKISQYSQYPP